MKLSKWHQELDQFIEIKSTFLMEGNIYDMLTYPTKTANDEVRWDLMFLDNYIYHYLKDNGYKNIVFYNHIDGFYNDFNRKELEEFCDISELSRPNDRGNSAKIEMGRAADIIRNINQNKSHLNAVVLMMAS